MRVLGIDPGLSATGYGIVERTGSRITPLGWGVIRSGDGSLAQRLSIIFRKITDVLIEHAPEMVAVEDIFTGKNPRSGLKLGHARGVLILAAAKRGQPIREYPAAAVKQAVVGRGRASKQQVGYMVGKLLGLENEKIAEDAADALAVAICCVLRERGLPMESGQVKT